MKILSGHQIREADQYTISHEPISSIHLMERASNAFSHQFKKMFPKLCHVNIFCGPGNNGGDGLAIARMLLLANYEIHVYVIDLNSNFSADFLSNQKRLSELFQDKITLLAGVSQIPDIKKDTIIIDAIFGTGLSRRVEGFAAQVIEAINGSGAMVVSVDMPSGLYTDTANKNTENESIIKANYTFTFQYPKLSFFYCSNSIYTGLWHILNIGLNHTYAQSAESSNYYIDDHLAKNLLKLRQRCDHKGIYGHALIWAGSYGKMGAAQLCTRACLAAGAGLTTAYIPESGYAIFQTALPEVMVLTDPDQKLLSQIPDLSKYSALGLGPGIGRDKKTAHALAELLHQAKDLPVVIDADALNIISENRELLQKLPANNVLTPHPKEFERLAGLAENDWERQKKAIAFAKENNCVLILKGAYTSINLPNGRAYYNATGNPGMAKGGSGDALTGIIAGLLAQKYTPETASVLGVYLHGLAGDIAALKKSAWSMTASDLIENLGNAFATLASP